MRRPIPALLAAALLVGSCGGDEDDGERGLEPLNSPSFADEPAETVPPSSSEVTSPVVSTTSPDTTAAPTSIAEQTTPTTASTTATIPLERVAFVDPVGDATRGVGTSTPPEWSDLAGAALERRGAAYRLEVRLGDTAPDKAPGSETMNIASFYDVDGDGAVDFEIWVNLDGNGWGPAWYDNGGGAAFGKDSDVTVDVAGDTVSLAFPAARLATPDRLRFSIASEYGDLATIGSSFARRDDAPDGDRAVPFP